MRPTKITCACCGKKTQILLKKSKSNKADRNGHHETVFTYIGPEIPDSEKWWYFGEIEITACATSKYFYTWDGVFGKKCNKKKTKHERVPNPRYNPKIKPKYVQYWECPRCRKHDNMDEKRKSCKDFKNWWCLKNGWQITTNDECPCNEVNK